MAGTIVADWTFRIADVAIVFATFMGPVVAVQAQKWLEKSRAINDRRNHIFRVLMATRAARLSPGHVEALNAVPVEFYGPGKKLKLIVDDWHAYLDTLENKANLEGQVIFEKRQNAFLDMLHKMSTYLGYSFNRSQLEKDVYYPTGHRVIEDDQDVIRRGVASLFKGETAIPMAVKEFPATMDQKTFDSQAALTRLLTEWMEGQRSVQVEQRRNQDHNVGAG
ncbi:hypothetical protein ADE_00750 [Achromobacter denitrificans]|uniref:DUF6680 family protein n=1 Tax=Achromobacter denitrificans TaxID=32002 RepID=UPI0016653DFC|nr:DUF6680 family protein [Achromobacter denitrificans]GFN24377.1 hypothetical protein ADE_00750 [Achromobacter denitrificans]